MTFETFENKFNDLSFGEKMTIYNEYCSEVGSDDGIYDFDDVFFDTYFNSKAEVCRATVFGSVNYSHDYIKFDGYGNLESISKHDAESLFEDSLEDIFEHEECWRDNIYDVEEEEEDEGSDAYICPNCGHVFEQGEYDFNYDSALLDFVCPECGWEGNENVLK